MIRILFAHPDQKLSQIYTRRIQDHFSVDSARDGLTALRRLKIQRPALVISDYHLPILSGISLLRFIRNNQEFSMIPFIFLSNHDDNTQALSLGANDWLDIKSAYPEFLLDRIYHHLKTNKHALQIH
ncbi:MAG TPA: response regulator [Patescibacteria group bacterium]